MRFVLLYKSQMRFCQIQYFQEQKGPRSTHEEARIVEDDGEFLSTLSIAVSLLCALLELGLEKRSEEEERCLKSMMPALASLSLVSLHHRVSEDRDHTTSRSEIAEMASHSMALIASRQEKGDDNRSHEVANPGGHQSVLDLLDQAETDLQSEQPPLRARGVVTLRHLARGFMPAPDDRRTGALVVEVSEPTNEKETKDAVLDRMLRICLASFCDEESYVFLASIQTAVAIVDIQPQTMLARIASGVAGGYVNLSHSVDGPDRIKLSPEQQIKLSEALLLTIRRRGKAIANYAHGLLLEMVYGRGAASADSATSDTARTVQQKTYDYFNQRQDDASSDLPDPREAGESRRLLASTGGPVFAVEETDVLRSSCVAIVAELILVAPPRVTAGFVAVLVGLVKDILSLERSRLLTRAGAFLGSALYMAVRNEDEEKPGEIHVARNLVVSGEDTMRSQLEKISTLQLADDGDKLFDPALVARCEEALDVRSTISNILAVANLAVSSESSESSTQTFLRRALQPTNEII